jgi:hypothetical protein
MRARRRGRVWAVGAAASVRSAAAGPSSAVEVLIPVPDAGTEPEPESALEPLSASWSPTYAAPSHPPLPEDLFGLYQADLDIIHFGSIFSPMFVQPTQPAEGV